MIVVAYNILADFFNLINPYIFDGASLLLVLCFVIWEVPRSIKIIDEEYTRGVYPSNGRVVDFVLFAIGLLSIIFFRLDDTVGRVVSFLKTPGITSFFLVILIVIPLIISLGFFKRFFGRMDKHESVTIFLVHSFLDFMHTVFFVSLTILVMPLGGYLLIG